LHRAEKDLMNVDEALSYQRIEMDILLIAVESSAQKDSSAVREHLKPHSFPYNVLDKLLREQKGKLASYWNYFLVPKKFS
tara:strand:- start:184 stop:423 length:240 start_codon:yes stop_codon:yes gene_type:complete